jgi:hypothetical protein
MSSARKADGEMTKDYVLYNLGEAAEELGRTLKEIESDSDYGDEDFYVAMAHIYHHLNTAWNARHASADRAAACTAEDFARWRQFPADIDMTLGL